MLTIKKTNHKEKIAKDVVFTLSNTQRMQTMQSFGCITKRPPAARVYSYLTSLQMTVFHFYYNSYLVLKIQGYIMKAMNSIATQLMLV